LILSSRISAGDQLNDLNVGYFHQTFPEAHERKAVSDAAMRYFPESIVLQSIRMDAVVELFQSIREPLKAAAKYLSDDTIEKLEAIPRMLQHVQNISRKYHYAAATIVSGGYQLDEVERYYKAIEYFKTQILEHFAIPIIHTLSELEQINKAKNIYQQIKVVIPELPSLFRNFLLGATYIKGISKNNLEGIKKLIDQQIQEISMHFDSVYRQKAQLGLHEIKPKQKKAKEPSKPKKPKDHSRKESLDLFKNGLTISEIAAGRGLVEGTIWSHLLKALVAEEIKLDEILEKHAIDEIRRYMWDHTELDSLGKLISSTEDRFHPYHVKLVWTNKLMHSEV
jgi:tetratricopeptide (TPR) repeat protein